MKRLSLAFALLLSCGLAQADSNGHMMGHDMHDMSSQNMAGHDMSAQGMPHDMQTMHQGMGVVKAINEKSGKVQIAHHPIASLGWPAMTMWFGLDAQHMHDIKVGDRVQFDMMQNDKKQWMIQNIEKL